MNCTRRAFSQISRRALRSQMSQKPASKHKSVPGSKTPDTDSVSFEVNSEADYKKLMKVAPKIIEAQVTQLSEKLGLMQKQMEEAAKSNPEIIDSGRSTDLNRRHPLANVYKDMIEQVMNDPEVQRASEPLLKWIDAPFYRWQSLTDGVEGTREWRRSFVFCNDDENGGLSPEYVMSPWHDVQLQMKNEDLDMEIWNKQVQRVQMVVTMPKGTFYDNQVVLGERMNPIRHRLTEDGRVRRFSKPLPFNVGILPRTWAHPQGQDVFTRKYGADHPLYCVDLSGSRIDEGPTEIKVLGCFGIFPKDRDTVQWVIVGVSRKDTLYDTFKEIDDVEGMLPGRLFQVREFFENFALGGSQLPNAFFNEGKIQNIEFATRVLNIHFGWWESLVQLSVPSPRVHYHHHPQQRHNLAKDMEPMMKPQSEFNARMGLTLKERHEKRWLDLDRREAFFQLQHNKHKMKLQEKQIAHLVKELHAASSHRALKVTRELKEMTDMSPPPRDPGVQAGFRDREWMRAQLERTATQFVRRLKQAAATSGSGEGGARFGLVADDLTRQMMRTFDDREQASPGK
eukprot:267945_1